MEFVLAALLALVPDEVTLKNGDRVTGTVVAMAGGKLQVATAHSGTISIDWTQIASIQTESKVSVRLHSGETVEGRLSTPEAGRLHVIPEDVATPIPVAWGRVTMLNPPPVAWHGFVEAAGRTTDGNTHTNSVLLSAEAEQLAETYRILAKAVFRYGETSGVITERNSYGLGKYEYKFNPDLYGYASAELFSDRFKDLTLRTVVSAGAGYRVYASPEFDLSTELGFGFVDNNFREADDESHSAARLGVLGRAKLPLGFELTNSFVYYANFEDTADWQFRNEGAVATSLGQGWTLRAGVITDFDNEPPEGLEEYDNTYFVGLGYRF